MLSRCRVLWSKQEVPQRRHPSASLCPPSSAESEVCKLETLLQSEVTVVTTGDVVGADAAKTPPSLRRRKRTLSRRPGDREAGGGGPGDRGDRGVGEERDRRETGKEPQIYCSLAERNAALCWPCGESQLQV